jgi:hypothetical protein
MLTHIKTEVRFRGYLLLRMKPHKNHILSLSPL